MERPGPAPAPPELLGARVERDGSSSPGGGSPWVNHRAEEENLAAVGWPQVVAEVTFLRGGHLSAALTNGVDPDLAAPVAKTRRRE